MALARKEKVVLIACEKCPARHIECGDCVITALLETPEPSAGAPLPLNAVERGALARLCAAGLISAQAASQAQAYRTSLVASATG